MNLFDENVHCFSTMMLRTSIINPLFLIVVILMTIYEFIEIFMLRFLFIITKLSEFHVLSEMCDEETVLKLY